MRNGKALAQIAISLVYAHYDDGHAFKGEAYKLAKHFEEHGEHELAEYVIAQICDACTFCTMEVDPLPRIARDMFEIIEGQLGKDAPKTVEFEQRLGQYMPYYCARARERRNHER